MSARERTILRYRLLMSLACLSHRNGNVYTILGLTTRLDLLLNVLALATHNCLKSFCAIIRMQSSEKKNCRW